MSLKKTVSTLPSCFRLSSSGFFIFISSVVMFLSFLSCLVPSVLSYNWAPDIICSHCDQRSFPTPALTLPLPMEEERELHRPTFLLHLPTSGHFMQFSCHLPACHPSGCDNSARAELQKAGDVQTMVVGMSSVQDLSFTLFLF